MKRYLPQASVSTTVSAGVSLDKLGVVVSSGAGTVTAANQVKVSDRAALYRLDHLIRHAKHRAMAEAGHDRAAAVDAGERLVLVVAAKLQCLSMTGVKSLSSPMCVSSG